MFIVFNKSKINSYLISFSTVATLFVMAFMITNGRTPEIEETSARVNENVNYSEKIDENLENKINE